MKKQHQVILAGLFSLCVCATSAVAADTSSFTGFTVGATAGMQHNKVEYSGYLDGRSQSDNNFVGGINAGYGFALGQSAVLTVGASYDVNSTEFGHMQYDWGGGTMADVSGKLKNHWTVYAAPGVRIGSQWLAYAKLAYHHAKTEFTDSIEGASSSNHHGIGYGAGVAYALTRNIELNAELHYVELSKASFSQSKGEPTLTTVNLGVNYRF